MLARSMCCACVSGPDPRESIGPAPSYSGPGYSIKANVLFVGGDYRFQACSDNSLTVAANAPTLKAGDVLVGVVGNLSRTPIGPCTIISRVVESATSSGDSQLVTTRPAQVTDVFSSLDAKVDLLSAGFWPVGDVDGTAVKLGGARRLQLEAGKSSGWDLFWRGTGLPTEGGVSGIGWDGLRLKLVPTKIDAQLKFDGLSVDRAYIEFAGMHTAYALPHVHRSSLQQHGRIALCAPRAQPPQVWLHAKLCCKHIQCLCAVSRQL